MEVILVSALNGLVYGMLLFMLASGLTLIFSMMGVLNFAHASIYMLGAYFAFETSRYIGFWPALIVAPVLCGAIGAAIEVWGLRRVHHNGHIAELLFTFGLAFIIERAVHKEVLATPEQLVELKRLFETIRLPEGQEEKWLAAAKAESGTVVVMDPRSGAILALATSPSYDQSNLSAANPSALGDRAVSGMGEWWAAGPCAQP